MMICWGTFCAAHAGVKGRGTLIALRLLLGAAEAGFVPTTFYFLSTIYPKYFLGFRLGLFSGMYSIAGAFAGLIAVSFIICVAALARSLTNRSSTESSRLIRRS